MENNYQINSILNHHGFIVKQIEPITTGKFNTSYFCEIKADKGGRLTQNAKVVLRIAPPDDAGFIFYEQNMMAQEPHLHQIIREKTSLRIPEIYVYDDSRKIINHNFLIMEFLPGAPLSESYLSPAKKDHVMRQTGRYLRELHDTCQATEYGYLGEHHCMKPQESWSAAFEIMWNKLIDNIVDCGVYDAEDSKIARQAFKIFRHLFERDVPASLLHMDVWGQNILVDPSGTITGIVDWDRALWGDPEIEFAVLDYCGFNNPAFWSGYEYHPRESLEFNIRMKLYHLYEVQKYLIIWTLRRNQRMRVLQYKHYSQKVLHELISMKQNH